jgi:hypothetical protein
VAAIILVTLYSLYAYPDMKKGFVDGWNADENQSGISETLINQDHGKSISSVDSKTTSLLDDADFADTDIYEDISVLDLPRLPLMRPW